MSTFLIKARLNLSLDEPCNAPAYPSTLHITRNIHEKQNGFLMLVVCPYILDSIGTLENRRETRRCRREKSLYKSWIITQSWKARVVWKRKTKWRKYIFCVIFYHISFFHDTKNIYFFPFGLFFSNPPSLLRGNIV